MSLRTQNERLNVLQRARVHKTDSRSNKRIIFTDEG